jgi:L-threonylcarbamoyladenylate synthase
VIVPASGDPAPDAAVTAAADALRAGLVIAIPTDTVYGVAAAISVPGATAALFAAKGRPDTVELPVLVAGAADAAALAELGPAAEALIDRFWPGALTVVVRRRPGVRAELGGDPANIGLRASAHPVARALTAAVGPLATTSANRHRQPTPATAAGVEAELGPSIALVLDGGRCEGLSSTVVDVTGPSPRLLREGRIAWTDVLQAV